MQFGLTFPIGGARSRDCSTNQNAQMRRHISNHAQPTEGNKVPSLELHSFGDFRVDFGSGTGTQAFVGERGQRDVITHDLVSKPTHNQSKPELFRYDRLSRYRPRCGGRRGGRVSNSANAKPIPPAINIEPSGLSCTFFAIACEPSWKVSPLFS